MTQYTVTKITPVGGYFTARDGFISIKYNGTFVMQSYINITTQIPANTPFANVGFTDSDKIHGSLGFLKIDGSKIYPVSFASQGRLSTVDAAIPTGYYFVIGASIYEK